MKTKSMIIALLLCSVSSFAQGTIFFNNRTSAGDVRISRPDGTGLGAGFTAQLYLQSSGGAFVPLLPSTTFRTSSPAAAYFVNPVDVIVPGIPAGEPATVVLRVWETSAGSYELSTVRGESAPLTIPGLGGVNPVTGAIVPTPDLAGLQFVPEPSSIALGILGAAALYYRRRK